MASMNMDKQLDDQPPAKKQRIDNPEEEGEIANSNEAGVPKSVDMMGHKESGTSTTIVDLPIHLPLPLELNCEIFKFLKFPIQRKFIWGLGRDIYGMFGQKLLKKTKRVRNPRGNGWNRINTRATVAADGLNANVNNANFPYPNIFAVQPFPTSGPHCRLDGFPGTICYYYEVKVHIPMCFVGLSDGAHPHNLRIGRYSNSYAISICDSIYLCLLAGERHKFELQDGGFQQKRDTNSFGCGLVLDAEDKLCIFFTLNGNLFGRKIRISPTVDRLFPAVTMTPEVSSFEANFGDDPAKPFQYDVKNCTGLELACI